MGRKKAPLSTGDMIKMLVDTGRMAEAKALMKTLSPVDEDDEEEYVVTNKKQIINNNDSDDDNDDNVNSESTFSTKSTPQRTSGNKTGSVLAKVEPWTKPKKLKFETNGVAHEFLNYPQPVNRSRPVQKKYVYVCSVCHKKEKHFPSEIAEGMLFKCNRCCTN